MKSDNNNFQEIFNYYELRKKIFDKPIIISNLILFKIFVYLLLRLFERKNQFKKNYLFINSKFKDILTYLGNNAIIIGFKNDYKFAKENNIEYKSARFWGSYLNFIYKYNINNRFIWQILEKDVEKFIKKKNIQYLVLSNDSAPLERFFIFVFRKLNKKSICIQHGISYNENYPIEYFDGNYVDELWLWSDMFYDSRKKSKQLLFGYPFKIKYTNENFEKNSICLIGQDFYHYSHEYGRIFLDMVNKIIDEIHYSCPDFVVYYKPHPNEKELSLLPQNVIIFKGGVQESFQKFEYIIGINSTVLIEAIGFKKKVIQIIGDGFFSVNFSKFGLLNIVHINEISNLSFIIHHYKTDSASITFQFYDNPGLEFKKRIEAND